MADVTEKGLREVIAADTVISDIDGEQGRLWYVGYDIADLAEHCTFEEVVYLLHNRVLPNQDQLDDLNEFLADSRELSPFLVKLMATLAQQASPMSMLRTTVSAASAYDPNSWDDSPEAEYRKAMRLIAKTPTLIAYYHRMRTGQEMCRRTRSCRTPPISCRCCWATSRRRKTPTRSTPRSRCMPITR